ncbi:MAG: IS110 family transposase [Dehalococcoidales bacterium]|nr:IS110 family transposase [Dehalococcoidales bacterium]
MHYIGMDCHITTMDFVVVDETGKVTKTGKVETGAKNFMEFVKSIRQPRTIFTEEGTLAAWALDVCVRFGEKLVITDSRKNRWIGASGQKDDPIDALKLAQLARGGYIKEIHHPIGQRRRFRELMMAYYDTSRDVTRIKNKIKAKFRQNGIQCTGQTVYSKVHREEWRRKLPQESALLVILDSLWLQLDQTEQTERNILLAAKAQGKQFPEIRLFKDVPGIGFITAATISAIVETPHRFANKRKLWMYAGLGIVRRSSGGKLYTEKLTSEYNRLLKYAVKQAAQAAIHAKDNPFRRTYLEMTLVKGIVPHRATLTIARDILSTMWAMWRNGEKYNPEIARKVKT